MGRVAGFFGQARGLNDLQRAARQDAHHHAMGGGYALLKQFYGLLEGKHVGSRRFGWLRMLAGRLRLKE